MTNLMHSAPSNNQEAHMSEAEASQHSDKVQSWREEQFLRLGFKPQVAEILAESKIDIEKTRKMMKSGCSVELALLILIGTDFAGEDHRHDWRWFAERVGETPN